MKVDQVRHSVSCRVDEVRYFVKIVDVVRVDQVRVDQVGCSQKTNGHRKLILTCAPACFDMYIHFIHEEQNVIFKVKGQG